MNGKVQRTIFCVLLLTLILTACGTMSTTTKPVPNTIPHQIKALTKQKGGPGPTELLQHVGHSMAAPKSVHFTLTTAMNPAMIESPSADLSQLLNPLGGPHPTEMQGKGDEVAPDPANVSSRFSLRETRGDAGSGSPFTLDEVVNKDAFYILGNNNQGSNNQWCLLSKAYLLTHPENTAYADYGMVQAQALISLAIREGSLSDMGDTTIDNKPLRHIIARYNKNTFDDIKAIDVENYSWPIVKAASVQNPQGSTDFWFDDNTGYIYRLDNTVSYEHSNGTITFTTVNTLRFEFSKFNEPITINMPSHAIAIKDVSQIYAHP